MQYQLEKSEPTKAIYLGYCNYGDKIVVYGNQVELTHFFVNQGSLIGSLPLTPNIFSFAPIYSWLALTHLSVLVKSSKLFTDGKLFLHFNSLYVWTQFFNPKGEVCLPTKKTFTLFNQHLSSMRIINFLNPARWNKLVSWFVNVMVQWSHLEPLQYILWFIAISSATWFCTDSEVSSYWDAWVIPGYWCESPFGPWSSASNVCDKSLQATVFVDPFSMGRSPPIQFKLLESSWGFNDEKRRYSTAKKYLTRSLRLFSLSELHTLICTTSVKDPNNFFEHNG